MSKNIPLKCHCGSLQGVAQNVSPNSGARLTCLCDDCQTYAHSLGSSERILDPYGGTDVFQLTPSQITLTCGTEQLRCLRLSKKGLMRWYAGCCNTPVANTLSSPKIPFAGVPHTFMDHEGHQQTREEDLGPILAKIQGKFSNRELPPDAHQRAPLRIILRSLRIFIISWVKGLHTPSPFFDATTGEPVVTPKVLSLEERNQYRSQ